MSSELSQAMRTAVAMARPGRGSAVVVLFALGLLAAANVATATTYEVGGASNWTIPSSTKNINYQTWADGHTFNFVDELVFSYQNDTHNVMLLNSTAFKACDVADQPISMWDSGEDVIELSQLSELTQGPVYYFACGKPGHCSTGQKFHITVVTYTPPPAASTTPSPPSPPGGGSARSLPQIGVLILTIAMVFCTNFVL